MFNIKRFMDVEPAEIDEQGYFIRLPEIFNILSMPNRPLVKINKRAMFSHVDGYVVKNMTINMDEQDLVNVWNKE